MNNKVRIDSLPSGLPRFVLNAAFAIMILAALCSYHSLSDWLYKNAPIPFSLLTTLGMVTIYYGFLRGMKDLPHPLTVLWWIAIGINLLDFVIGCFGEALHGVAALSATFLPLIYLPLGILLFVWYRGRLGLAGIWMVIRILVLNLVPVLFYYLGLFELPWGIPVMEVITIGVDLWYAWALRRVLV